jgi:hypothetical protein
LLIPDLRPHDPERCPPRFRLFPVRSPLLRESRLLSFPADTEMFQFPAYVRAFWDRRALGRSPRLFAAFHARLLPMTPRHPPRALRSLTTPIRRRLNGAQVLGKTRASRPPNRRVASPTTRSVSRRGQPPSSNDSLYSVRVHCVEILATTTRDTPV